MAVFPPGVRDFAATFAALQKERQMADYALDGKDMRAAIDIAEDAIAGFEQAGARHRRAFVAHVLFRRRPR